MVTFYDRDNLMEFCTHTVLHNLVEGILFVTVIVFIFMADWRTTCNGVHHYSAVAVVCIPLPAYERHERQPDVYGRY